MAKTDYQDIYGKRPDKLKRDAVDAEKQQKAAIKSNLDAAIEAGDLSRQAGELDTDTLLALMERISPNITAGGAEQMQMARDMMAGKFDPTDVIRHGASRGFDMGTPDSQFANFGELQSYGINQMAYMQKGAEMFGAIQDRTRAMTNPMSVTSMFMTPEQRLGHATGESDRNVELGAYERNRQAMPDAGLVAQQDTARMAAISGMGQTGPQLVGPLNPSRNTSLMGAAQGLSNPFSGGLAGYQGRAAQRLKGNYSSANYTTA